MAGRNGFALMSRQLIPCRAAKLVVVNTSCPIRWTSTSRARRTTPKHPTKPPSEHEPNTSKRSRFPTRTLAATSIFLIAAYYLYDSPSDRPTILNDTTFVPYTITSRTSLSPSSFVITVAPQSPNPNPPYLLPGTNRWRHPLWSVEFKQPEVQISRHYTPLPPSAATPTSTSPPPASKADSDGQITTEISEEAKGALRFYIRAVGDGEMSRYLNRLREGQTVHLRGPHVGFDLVRRLGACKNIVFLAGGTGVVPGMQAARVALDGYEDTNVSLLWAVRQRVEIQSGKASAPADGGGKRNWWLGWDKNIEPAELDPALEGGSPVANQLADMKKQYGDRFNVQVVVDEENTTFASQHVQKALAGIAEGHPSPSNPGVGCSLHDQKRHETASEFEGSGPECRCSPIEGALPGKNLFIVSGPDGFVTHYAGAKRWLGGRHTQGPVGGVVGLVQHQDPQLARDWLVLKL